MEVKKASEIIMNLTPHWVFQISFVYLLITFPLHVVT